MRKVLIAVMLVTIMLSALATAGMYNKYESKGNIGNKCKTLWAWNGEHYIKRDVIFAVKSYKGDKDNLPSNVRVIGHNIIEVTKDGDKCKALNSIPKKKGIKGVSEDISTLPYKWWTE